MDNIVGIVKYGKIFYHWNQLCLISTFINTSAIAGAYKRWRLHKIACTAKIYVALQLYYVSISSFQEYFLHGLFRATPYLGDIFKYVPLTLKG